jgi:Outer membrane efflux protein
MARLRLLMLAGWCLLVPLAGCAHLAHVPALPPLPVPHSASPDDLPVCGREEVTVDLAAPLLPVRGPETLGRLTGTPPYHLLGAQECLCRAVNASTTANLEDLEQQAISVREENDSKNCKGRESPEAQLQHTILYYLALEDRNRSGAEALNKYYQLGAAEGDVDILRKSLALADSVLAKARNLRAQGVEVTLDETKLHDQQLDLQAQSLRLRLNIEQLNSDLRVALSFCPSDEEWRFWPSEAFQVGDEPVLLATAVAVGLANRPELVLLGLLEKELNSDNQNAVQQMLRAISNALAMIKSPPHCPMLHMLLARMCAPCHDDTRELLIRRAQLREYHAHRERVVVEQIGQAVRTIQAQRELVTLAQQQAKSWEAKVREARNKEQQGVGSFVETTDAEEEWLKARRKIIEETANLQRARVLLHQAQGILPCECEPPPHSH